MAGDLTGVIISLAVSAEFSGKYPFEAECAKMILAGKKRAAVQTQIAIMEHRSRGESVDKFPDTASSEFPSVIAAKRQDFPSDESMVQALTELVGGEHGARRLLIAHRVQYQKSDASM